MSEAEGGMILMLDNYDSFTYNLVQYLRELGAEVTVRRNDSVGIDDIRAMRPQKIVISPGPCTPAEAGVSVAVAQAFGGAVPLLGVCLGHQAIAAAHGGAIIRARRIMHGKTSLIHHDGSGLFEGLPNPFQATRYHSLVVDESSLPDCLRVNAWTQTPDGGRDEIMAFAHRRDAVAGIQFHPESILTPCGHDILRNFLRMA